MPKLQTKNLLDGVFYVANSEREPDEAPDVIDPEPNSPGGDPHPDHVPDIHQPGAIPETPEQPGADIPPIDTPEISDPSGLPEYPSSIDVPDISGPSAVPEL